MVLCGLGMQQHAMHNATIQKTTFFELGVYNVSNLEKETLRTTIIPKPNNNKHLVLSCLVLSCLVLADVKGGGGGKGEHLPTLWVGSVLPKPSNADPISDLAKYEEL